VMTKKSCQKNHTHQNSHALVGKAGALQKSQPQEKTVSLAVGQNGKKRTIYRDNLCKHPLYEIWCAMRARCNNPKHISYKNYGGRGITVCDRWNRFAMFLEDMGERPTPYHEIDRIDNDGNYTPENCRWATHLEQMQHTRKNRFIKINGEVKTIAQWARFLGIPKSRINCRLHSGMTIERAFSVEKFKQGSRKLSPEDVIKIRNDKRSCLVLASIFGIAFQTVCKVRNRSRYKDIV